MDGFRFRFSVPHRIAALRVKVLFYLFEDSPPALEHIIGVVDSLVRQLQHSDHFVVEILKIQSPNGLLPRSFGIIDG